MRWRTATWLFIFLAFGNSAVIAQQAPDSLAQKENRVIEEVLASDSNGISKEKAATVLEVTKYGFKDLFKNYTYNPAIPYSQQINPYAENYMQDYLRAHSTHLQNLKKTATPYFNLIDGILSQYGLPHELKYLAVIESDLKTYALSVAGARGPWQFMPGTARGYGLIVNNQVDERTDFEKSTRAAAKYLLTLYREMNDWLLVIAAYNGGPGRVYSAIKKSGSRDFWKLQYQLPEESRNHVKKFIATHFVMENGNGGAASFYTSGNGDVSNIPDSVRKNLDSVMISGRYSAMVIASAIGMDPSLFNKINPQLDQILGSGEEYKLQLPKEKMEIFREKKLDILNQSVNDLLLRVRESAKREKEPGKKN